MGIKKTKKVPDDTPLTIDFSANLKKALEEQIANNPIDAKGNLFLSEDLSLELDKLVGNKTAIEYFSRFLNAKILLVGYYAANFENMKKEAELNGDEAIDQNLNRTQLLKHVYFSMPMPEVLDEDSETALKTPVDFDKATKKLLQILDLKPMNGQGYVFLTESERDELGQEFLLKQKKITLDGYAHEVLVGGVKPEIEEGMEKRFKDYTFDALDKYERLVAIVYPIFPNVKVKGRANKGGWQAVDKKQMPLFLWTLLMLACFVAAICIIIWTFGFVVPTTATAGIFESPNPPVDGALVIQSLFPNAWTFFSHVAASITIFVFLFFLAWRPAKEAVEKRHQYIADQIQNAEKMNKEADIKLAYASKVELSSFLKANELIEETIKNSTIKKEAIEKEAKETADAIRNLAQEDANRIHQKMEMDIKKEIADNSILIASELLKRNISSQDNQQFVDDFIKNLQNHK